MSAQPILPTSSVARSPRTSPPSKLALLYDIAILILIVIDLTMIGMDLVLMSSFAQTIGGWLGMTSWLEQYALHWHDPVRFIGGLITLFLVAELLLRWVIAIVTKRYLRWFFFPFVHWYEVLGCFPQLRALRLLRAVFIGRKLYQLGYQVLPEKWIEAGRFYYALVLEELSDRVILTATDNLRQQFAGDGTQSRLLSDTFEQNRHALQTTLATVLRAELTPKLKHLASEPIARELAVQVGASVQDALADTPELRRYLRMIPIAGKMIEGELQTISSHIGENLVNSLTARLTDGGFIDPVVEAISDTIAHVDLSHPELEALISTLVDDGLTAFETQIKIQQWKHSEHLDL